MKRPAPHLLECTLRDGNYAVDFRFTASDTSALTAALAGLGFEWIEVGHGFGLNASEAGKGPMPASDAEIVRAAKAVAGASAIGMFCIPGIAALEHLDMAREAGLDFVRIGYDAPGSERALPYIDRARSIGLVPFFNFMKTYAITPSDFARRGEDAVAAGAEGVYCVDSAGNMFPDDVARYLDALHARIECRSGFHAHNNLQLAVANAIRAWECGAEFVDTTLFGIGRSAGNVPTEVAVAVFDLLGAPTGLDPFAVMDAAESYMEPLMSHIQMYDMTSVAMGYSGFHSSFYGPVAAAARRHGVDVRRLIDAVAKVDRVHLDPDALEKAASALPPADPTGVVPALVSFSAPHLADGRMSTSIQAVETLVDGMTTSAAKRRALPALEFVAAVTPSDDLVLADILLTDPDVVLGRVTYGSYEALSDVLAVVRDRVSLALVDSEGGAWAAEAFDRIVEAFGEAAVLPVSSRRLLEEYTESVLRTLALSEGSASLLVCGVIDAVFADRLASLFASVRVFGAVEPGSADERVGVSPDARSAAQGHVDVALFLAEPTEADEAVLEPSLEGAVRVSFGAPRGRGAASAGRPREVRLRPADAYRGLVERAAAVSRAIRDSHEADQ